MAVSCDEGVAQQEGRDMSLYAITQERALEKLAEAVADRIRQAPEHSRDLRRIACSVAELHGVTVAELRGPIRERRVAWPRQDFMLAANKAGHSLTRIGDYLGGRDHTTVLHGIRRARERAAE